MDSMKLAAGRLPLRCARRLRVGNNSVMVRCALCVGGTALL